MTRWFLVVLSLTVMFEVSPLAWLSPGCAANPGKENLALQEGRRLLGRGEFRKAAEQFRAMKESCGGKPVCMAYADFYRARCLLEMTQYDEALDLLQEVERVLQEAGKSTDLGVVYYVKARAFSGKGEYEKAIASFTSAERLLLEAGDAGRGELGLLYGNRAAMHINLCNYDAARADLSKARQLLAAVGSDRVVELDRFEAQIRARTQDYAGAEEIYQKLLGFYRKRKERKRTALILNDLGHIREARSEYAQAEKRYQEALDLAREVGDPGTEASALNNLGNVKWETGQYEAARELFVQALKIRKKLGQTHLYANALNNLGIVLLGLGEYDPSVERFREAFAVFKQIGSRNGKATTLHNMALVFKDVGRFRQAQRFSEEAIRIAGEIHDRKLLATAILRLGNLYEYYGEFGKALSEYEKAAEIQRRISDRFFLSNTLVDTANLRVRRGEVDRAESDYREALDVRRAIGAPLAEALCKCALFYIEKPRYAPVGSTQRNSDLEKADKLCREADEVLKRTHMNDVMLLTYVSARLGFERGDFDGSRSLFSKLESQAGSTGSLRFAFLANVGLGMAHEQRNELPEAEKAFSKAVDYAEAIRETLDLKARATFLNGEEILGIKHIHAYEGLARVIFGQQDYAKSQAVSERTKARAFADTIERSIRNVLETIDPELHGMLERLAAQMKANREERAKCLAAGGDQSEIKRLETVGENLSKELGAIEILIKKNHPSFHSVLFPDPAAVDISGVGESEWILSYEVTESGTLVFLNKGPGVVRSSHVSIPARELNALIEEFRAPLQAVRVLADLKKFDRSGLRAGKRLFHLLVSPILESLPEGAGLTIVPDGPLGLLPFEALPAAGGYSRLNDRPRVVFFGERNSISYYQSITAMNLVRARAKTGKGPGSRFLVVAHPTVRCADDVGRSKLVQEDSSELKVEWRTTKAAKAGSQKTRMLSHETCALIDDHLSPLRETADLAADLQTEFAGQVEAFVAGSATLKSFEEKVAPRIQDYGRILFATHGILGGTFHEIQEPAILLSMPRAGADSWLRMSRVLELRMNPEVVFLLACETGLGEQLPGEGIMGLGRAFQLAGSRSVLMSLWKVEVRASTLLCKMFFQNLKKGHNKKKALALARSRLRSLEGGVYDHPFFWAAFVLAGEVN